MVEPARQATKTIPVVFSNHADPVGIGHVASLARPGGNATGFTQYEYGVGAKLLELLKEISPGVMRAVAASPDGVGQFAAIQAGQAIGLSPVEWLVVQLAALDHVERVVVVGDDEAHHA